MSRYVVSHPKMAHFHFTGSTAVFQSVWKQVGEHIAGYANYPRLVGETGGKDYIFAHPSADVEPLVAALVRGPSSSRVRSAPPAPAPSSPPVSGPR